MIRRDTLHVAAGKAQAASDTLILIAAYEGTGRTPPLAKLIEAEAALYEAIDLIWQSKEPARDRFLRVAREASAAPYETQAERMVA